VLQRVIWGRSQKLFHAVDILCINYHDAFQRKKRADSWNDCHSRIECLDSKSAIKNMLGFRACNFQHSSLASGRAVFSSEYPPCGADPSSQQSKKAAARAYRLPASPARRNALRAKKVLRRHSAGGAVPKQTANRRYFRPYLPHPIANNTPVSTYMVCARP
jgi:hypothetical protein